MCREVTFDDVESHEAVALLTNLPGAAMAAAAATAAAMSSSLVAPLSSSLVNPLSSSLVNPLPFFSKAEPDPDKKGNLLDASQGTDEPDMDAGHSFIAARMGQLGEDAGARPGTAVGAQAGNSIGAGFVGLLATAGLHCSKATDGAFRSLGCYAPTNSDCTSIDGRCQELSLGDGSSGGGSAMRGGGSTEEQWSGAGRKFTRQATRQGKGGLGQGPWQFGDGTVSLKELVFSLNFQVFAAIHIIGVLSFFRWHSWRLAALCFLTYTLRMFGITGGYHRLLSHRSFKTSRVGQFVFACLGAAALQKGPLWWASHHRHHHRNADLPEDAHSPIQYGFWWSHFGWFLCSTKSASVLWGDIPDLRRYPELCLLDRYHFIPPLLLASMLYAAGGWAAVGWGFMLSTVFCWHATYCINSLAHLIGTRRYTCEFNTHCDARNNLALAIATLGEGWHNNHHCYMRAARHGFYDHEVDVTFYILLLLRALGLVWGLELPPMAQLESKRYGSDSFACRCGCVEDDLKTLLAEEDKAGTNGCRARAKGRGSDVGANLGC